MSRGIFAFRSPLDRPTRAYAKPYAPTPHPLPIPDRCSTGRRSLCRKRRRKSRITASTAGCTPLGMRRKFGNDSYPSEFTPKVRTRCANHADTDRSVGGQAAIGTHFVCPPPDECSPLPDRKFLSPQRELLSSLFLYKYPFNFRHSRGSQQKPGGYRITVSPGSFFRLQ